MTSVSLPVFKMPVLLLCGLLACSFCNPVVGDDVQDVSLGTWDSAIKDNPYVLVLFYETDCMTCEDAKKVLDSLPEPDMFPGTLKKVKCGDITLAKKYQVTSLPGFVLFRNQNPVIYDGHDVNEDEISHWLMTAHQVATQALNDDSFEHLTQASTGSTTGDWFVLFYKNSCMSCHEALATLESFGVRMKGKMNVAKVDMDDSPKLIDRMKIKTCPSAIFYRQGKMYRYEVDKYDSESMRTFVEGWYKNMKAESVPREKTAFDKLTDTIALAIKKQLEGPNRKMFLGVSAGVAVSIVLIFVICMTKSKSSSKHKDL